MLREQPSETTPVPLSPAALPVPSPVRFVQAPCKPTVSHSLALHRFPCDPHYLEHRPRELPADRGGAAGRGPDQGRGRDAPLPAVGCLLPLPAASHHPGRGLLPAAAAVHREPGHHPDLRCCGHTMECLLPGWPHVRCVPGGGRADQQHWPPGQPALWQHHLGCGPCGRAGRLRGNSHQ